MRLGPVRIDAAEALILVLLTWPAGVLAWLAFRRR
jgi:hypothetical protein